MNKRSDRLLVLFGNQLFPNSIISQAQAQTVFMAESAPACRRYEAHRHKLVLILSAMRSKAEALRRSGYDVHYTQLSESSDQRLDEMLDRHLGEHRYAELVSFETESRSIERRLDVLSDTHDLKRVTLESPMFLTPRGDFEKYRERYDRLFMADFYKWQRKRLSVLMTDNGEPVGGRWSFDEDNRRKLPKGHTPPEVSRPTWTKHTEAVVEEVNQRFAAHPGDAKDFWLPTTEEQAEEALARFLDERFRLFGDYEDALSREHATLYHSLLSPLLNVGLLNPAHVLERAIVFASHNDIPINSLEGFVRQIIGWREFIRGIWHALPSAHWEQDFWGHRRSLKGAWYDGSTGVPPLDDAIRRAQARGYGHHIERLMVVGNLMLLCQVAPPEAYRWFMEMYVDSADWVMAPNVYGMALFSEGGAFTTKPYICGSNYLRKMSDYGKGPWCDVVDGLYWSFVHEHRDFFAKNPRSKMMLGTLDRMAADRKARIYRAAETFVERVTDPPQASADAQP